MNKLLAAFLTCVLLSGCSGEAAQPSGPIDIASIVEPIETYESSENTPLSAEKSGPSDGVSSSEEEISSRPKALSASSVSASSEKKPASTVEASKNPESSKDPVLSEPESNSIKPDSEPERELLPALSPEKRIDTEIIERELIRLINEERAAVGAEALGIEENMRFAARIRAGETMQSFSHTRPNGMPYHSAFDEAGFSYAGKWHGENLSSLHFAAGMYQEKDVALEMFDTLKNSPGHYRNMVSENFLQAGIGAVVSYNGTNIYVVSAQLFSSL